MIPIDLSNKVALITGGTGGIGLAAGLELGAAGARSILTYRWGSTPEEEIRRLFQEKGAPDPMIIEADVSREEDTPAVMEKFPKSMTVLISLSPMWDLPSRPKHWMIIVKDPSINPSTTAHGP